MEKLLSKFRKTLCEGTTDLFNGITLYDDLDNLCIEWLKRRDYVVYKLLLNNNIKTIEDLVIHFYNLLEYYHDLNCSPRTGNFKKDIKLLSLFVEHRQKALGVSKDKALQECATIIDYLFKFEDKLNLPMPIGIWVFSLESSSWIIKKVLSLIDQQQYLENEYKVSKMVDDFDNREAHTYEGFDLDFLENRS